jgi:hypothetical protein
MLGHINVYNTGAGLIEMKLKVKKNVFALVLACLMVFIAVAGCAQNTLTPTPGSGAPGPGEPAPSDDTVPSVYGVRPVVGGYVLYNGQRQPDANVYWDGYAWSTSMSGGEWSNDPIEYVPGVH